RLQAKAPRIGTCVRGWSRSHRSRACRRPGVEQKTARSHKASRSEVAAVADQAFAEQVAGGGDAFADGEAVEHIHQLTESGAARTAAGGVAAAAGQAKHEAVV